MYSNMGGAMLGLEMPFQQQKHQQIMSFPQQNQQQQEIIDHHQQTQLSMKQPNFLYQQTQKSKIQATQITNSDEDEPNSQNDQENNSTDLKRKNGNNAGLSPWHRMKWTDNMVRLLIMAVYYIGDETGGSELVSDKKKSGSGSGSGAGALQKKGKWKSVSRAMMEKGFYVSPQQCEDKFNDLNKRYKRVNDILGKGTSCKVVENQSLLETMDIAPKLKEEVRKLLNSKHLFFREMCAYHNSCGHNNSSSSNNNNNNNNNGVESAVVRPIQPLPQRPMSSCLHSTQEVQKNNSIDVVEDDEEDDDEDDDEDDEEDVVGDHEEGSRHRKRARNGLGNGSKGLDYWSGEVMGMLQDGSKSSREKKQWVMTQMVELEENGVKIRREGLELEKERLKWMKFSSKKEREMERLRIENEKKRLENERMLLLLRKNEIDLLFVEQH